MCWLKEEKVFRHLCSHDSKPAAGSPEPCLPGIKGPWGYATFLCTAVQRTAVHPVSHGWLQGPAVSPFSGLPAQKPPLTPPRLPRLSLSAPGWITPKACPCVLLCVVLKTEAAPRTQGQIQQPLGPSEPALQGLLIHTFQRKDRTVFKSRNMATLNMCLKVSVTLIFKSLNVLT